MKDVYVHRRDNGTDRVTVTVRVDGKKFQKSTTYRPVEDKTAAQNLKMAEIMGAKFIEQCIDEYWNELENKEMTFERFFEEVYVEKVEGPYEGTTADSNVNIIRKNFLPLLAGVKLKEIDSSVAQELVNTLCQKNNENDRSSNPSKIQSQTVQRYMSVFFSVVHMAVEEGILDKDPFTENMRYPKPTYRNFDAFDENDFNLIISDLTDRVDMQELSVEDIIVAIGMMSGLRRGEMGALKWGNLINFRPDTLDCVKIDVQNSAKKRKGKKQECGRTKTISSIRMFTIPKLLAEVLWAWREQLRKQHIPTGIHNYIICNENGGMVSVYSLTKWFKGYLNTPEHTMKDVRLHSLRHTFASMFLELEPDVYLLKEVMGHQRLATTERYLKSFKLRRNDLMQNLNAYTDRIVKSKAEKDEN